MGENWVEGVGGLECGRGEVEAVEMSEIGLVAWGGGEGPVGEKDAGGVRGETGGAEGAGVPDVRTAGGRGRGTGDRSVGMERGEERLIGEWCGWIDDVALGRVIPPGYAVFAELVEDGTFRKLDAGALPS